MASVISQLSGRGGPCPGAPRVFMHQQPPAALSPPAAPRASPARPPACGKRLPGKGEAAGAKAAFGAAQTARLPGPALPKNASPPPDGDGTQRDAPEPSVAPASPSPIFPLAVILADSVEPAGFLGRLQLKLCLLPASAPCSPARLQTRGLKTRLRP